MHEDLWNLPPVNERPRVLINMVSSLDGKASAEGRASSIGGELDRRVMRILRSRADGVMVGAGTLRAEKMALSVPDDLVEERLARGRRAQPLAIVLTSSGDISLEENLIDHSVQKTLVVAPPGQGAVVGRAVCLVEVPASDAGRVDLWSALRLLKRAYGINLLLVEGGPSLNHALIFEGLVDEVFLTIAPKVLGGSSTDTLTITEGPAFPPEVQPSARLLSAHLVDGEIFLRYELSPSVSDK